MALSQKDKVLRYLQQGKSITPIDALKLYGCFRLADVVFRLKKDGYDIQTNMVKNDNGKDYASYRLLTTKDGLLNL